MNKRLLAVKDHFDRKPGVPFAICMLVSFIGTWFKLWILALIPLVLATPLYVGYIAYGWHLHFRVFGFVIYFGLIGLLIHAFACIYQDIGLMDGDQLITSRADAIYFSVVTWTTLGYGDLHPVPQARLWAATEALLGYIYMGILIALLTDIIGWKSPREALQDKMIKLSQPPYVIGPFPDPPVADVDFEGLLVPPWIKYPNIPFGSFGGM